MDRFLPIDLDDGYTISRPSDLRKAWKAYCERIRPVELNRAEVISRGDMAGDIVFVPTPVPLSLSGFLTFCGLTRYRWKQFRDNEAYADICDRIELQIEQENIDGAMTGTYNAGLAARLHRIADKQETEATVKLEPITGMRIVTD